MSVFVSDETGAGHLRMNMKIAVSPCVVGTIVGLVFPLGNVSPLGQ